MHLSTIYYYGNVVVLKSSSFCHVCDSAAWYDTSMGAEHRINIQNKIFICQMSVRFLSFAMSLIAPICTLYVRRACLKLASVFPSKQFQLVIMRGSAFRTNSNAYHPFWNILKIACDYVNPYRRHPHYRCLRHLRPKSVDLEMIGVVISSMHACLYATARVENALAHARSRQIPWIFGECLRDGRQSAEMCPQYRW